MSQRLEPISPDMKEQSDSQSEAAINLIRRKVAQALGEEIAEPQKESVAEKISKQPNRHQLFMQDLATSGKSLAEIQTEWHRYYTMLPDVDKQQIWDDFYEANKQSPYQTIFAKQIPETRPFPSTTANQPQPISIPSAAASNFITVAEHEPPAPPPVQSHRNNYDPRLAKKTKDIKNRIETTVKTRGKLKAKQHVQSALFGLSVGAIVLFILLFGFFNEMVLAPFIQPSRKAIAETPIISTTTADAAAPTIIVPKINIQIPVDFNIASIDEQTVQASLKGGVVHYPSTSVPGQNGNGAYFGHSSQNVFNNGKYKYAFVLLHKLTTGDVFSIVYNGKVYYYQVFAREIVPPTQISVLNDTKGKLATAALITCDPPGFSTNRLVVWGEQISPSVGGNTAPSTPDVNMQPAELADKGPSAWQNLIRAFQFWKQN